jgi:hypothetical protein
MLTYVYVRTHARMYGMFVSIRACAWVHMCDTACSLASIRKYVYVQCVEVVSISKAMGLKHQCRASGSSPARTRAELGARPSHGLVGAHTPTLLSREMCVHIVHFCFARVEDAERRQVHSFVRRTEHSIFRQERCM